MPRTIDEGFRDFVARLTPSSAESVGVKSHRASIEGCLKNNFGLLRFVRIGSFGNGTSISGYSDVDYLASLPTAKLTSNSTYSMQKVRDVLSTRFPNTGVRISCPAIVCPFGGAAAERTEIVIGDYLSQSNGYKVYDISDCADGWMKASPDAHNAYVDWIDNRLDKRVKPLIRYLKAWKYYQNVPISSFYLELRVARYAREESSIVYDIDFARVLRDLWGHQLADMQDPMRVSGMIPACKTAIKKADALSKLYTALSRADKAREATERLRINDAFGWWRLLFNDQFPNYYY